MTLGRPDELDALLDRIAVVAGRPRTVAELPGGLTNQNLRVTTPDGDYVVRRFKGDTELLGIDRDAEHDNTVAAAEAGVGAPFVDYRRDLGALVIGYVDGVTFDNDSFDDPGRLARAGRAIRRLHDGPRFTGDFDMFTPAGGVPAHRAGARVPAPRRLRGPRRRVRAGTSGARRPRRRRRCRATTTCSPATSSRTAGRCG